MAKREGSGIAASAQSSIFGKAAQKRAQTTRSVTRAEQQLLGVLNKISDINEKINEQEEKRSDAVEDFLKFTKQEIKETTKVTETLVKQLKIRHEIAKETERQTKMYRDYAKEDAQRIRNEITGRTRAMRSAEAYSNVMRDVRERVGDVGQALTWQSLALRAAGAAWYQAQRGMIGAMQTMRELPVTAGDAALALQGITTEMVEAGASTHRLAATYHVSVNDLSRSQDLFLRRFNRSRGEMQRIVESTSREALEAQATMGVDLDDTLNVASERMQAGQSSAAINRQLRAMRYMSEAALSGSNPSRGSPEETNYFFNNRSALYRMTVEIAKNTKVQHVDLVRIAALSAATGRTLEGMGETQQDALEATEKLVTHFMDTQNSPDVVKWLTGGALGTDMRRELRTINESTAENSDERRTRLASFDERYGIEGDETRRASLRNRVASTTNNYGDRRWLNSTFGASAAGVRHTADFYSRVSRQAGPAAAGSLIQGFIPGLRDNQAEDLGHMFRTDRVAAEEELGRLMREARDRAARGESGGGVPAAASVQNAAEAGLQENLNRFLDNNVGLTVAVAGIGATAELIARLLGTRNAASTVNAAATPAANVAANVAANAAEPAAQVAAQGGRLSRFGARIANSGVGRFAAGIGRRVAGSGVGRLAGRALRGAAGLAKGAGRLGLNALKPAPLIGAGLAAYDIYRSWDSNQSVYDNLTTSRNMINMIQGVSSFTGAGLVGAIAGEGGKYAADALEARGAASFRRDAAGEITRAQEANRNNLGAWLNDPSVAAKLQTPEGRRALNNYMQGTPSSANAEAFKRLVARIQVPGQRGATTTPSLPIPTAPRNPGNAPTPDPSIFQQIRPSTGYSPLSSNAAPSGTNMAAADLMRGNGNLTPLPNGDWRMEIVIAGGDRAVAEANMRSAIQTASGLV